MSNAQPTRLELVQLITENLDVFSDSEHIEALFHVTVEDLVSGGVDEILVGAAMIRAWVRLQEARIGRVAVVEAMRNIADRIERRVLDNHPAVEIPLNKRAGG